MKNVAIFLFILCETYLLSFGDAKAIYSEPSSHTLVPEQTIHGTTEDVSTRIKHISHETDQSSAKATVIPTMTPSLPIERKNSTNSDSLDKTNSTKLITLEVGIEKSVIKHIARKRAALYEVTMPFNFKTLHMPCEMDLPFNFLYKMPHHCQWLYNIRFNSESTYRAYMLLKAEAFFFGQYHERLRRYELNPNRYYAFD